MNIIEYYNEQEVCGQVTLDYCHAVDGKEKAVGQLVFSSKDTYVYWQYMRGILTEDEFFERVGITSWEERDDTTWQHVQTIRTEVMAAETGQAVTVKGYFGDEWLSKLFPSNVGPSSVGYSFDTCELVEVLGNGDAKVFTMSSDDYYTRFEQHDGKERRRRIYCYKRREAIVPKRFWGFGGRGIIHQAEEPRAFLQVDG